VTSVKNNGRFARAGKANVNGTAFKGRICLCPVISRVELIRKDKEKFRLVENGLYSLLVVGLYNHLTN
jgi:hypothetical protein